MYPNAPNAYPTVRRRNVTYAVLAVLLAVIAVAAGLGGFLAGRAAVKDATLMTSVTNEQDVPASVQLYVNGDYHSAMTLLPGETRNLPIAVTFASPHGMFEVKALPASGISDTERVTVVPGQTATVSLRVR